MKTNQLMKFVALSRKLLLFFIIYLLILPGTQTVYAGENPVINVAAIRLSDTISKRSFYLEDSFHTITPAQLPGIAFSTKPLRNIFRQVNTKQVQNDWYLRFILGNDADSAITICFFPGIYFTQIDIYRYNDRTGLVELIPTVMPSLHDSIGYRTLVIPAHSTTTYYAKLHFVKTNINAFEPCIIRDYYLPFFNKIYKIPRNNSNIYTYLIVGILTMMSFYALAVFALNGTSEFLYYSCYALLMGLLFFLNAFFFKTPDTFQYYFQGYLDFVIQSAGAFFYFSFLRKFLATKTTFPFLNKIFLISQGIIIVSIALFSYLNFYSNNFVLQDQVENLTKYEWFVTTIIFIVYAIMRNNKMLNYLAAGHFFLLLGGILSLVFIQFPALFVHANPIWRDSLFTQNLG
jgi:hypothetical protein